MSGGLHREPLVQTRTRLTLDVPHVAYFVTRGFNVMGGIMKMWCRGFVIRIAKNIHCVIQTLTYVCNVSRSHFEKL